MVSSIVIKGRLLKIAMVRDEDYQEQIPISSPSDFDEHLRKELRSQADIFTFSQKPGDHLSARFPYPYEFDSIAAIGTNSFDEWWTHRVSSDLRKDVRRAAKRGVVVRTVPFSDELVHQIMDIYDETPVRQNHAFWHYHEPFEVVKTENSTYLDRSHFLGAFFQDELIGFMKIVDAGRLACLMQIIAKDSHRDKRPMNALIAKAVEMCASKTFDYLTYGKYRYFGVHSSLTAFKHRCGFEEILVPKYYVPLTAKGRIAIMLRLHRGVRALLPVPLQSWFRQIRAFLYGRFNRHGAVNACMDTRKA